MTPEKTLAAHNRLSNMVIPTGLIVILTIFSFKFINEEISTTAVVILIIAYIILTGLLVSGYKSKDIYYDSNNLYLKGSNGITTVPLSRVRKLNMTSGNASVVGFKFHQYTIVYAVEEALTEIHFWTFIHSDALDDFEKQLKEANPYAKVEHWTAR